MSDINEEINRMVDKFSDDLRKKLLAYVGKRVTQAYKEGMKEAKPSASSARHTVVSSPPPASTRGRGRPAKVSVKDEDEAVPSRTSSKYKKRSEDTSEEESD